MLLEKNKHAQARLSTGEDEGKTHHGVKSNQQLTEIPVRWYVVSILFWKAGYTTVWKQQRQRIIIWMRLIRKSLKECWQYSEKPAWALTLSSTRQDIWLINNFNDNKISFDIIFFIKKSKITFCVCIRLTACRKYFRNYVLLKRPKRSWNAATSRENYSQRVSWQIWL